MSVLTRHKPVSNTGFGGQAINAARQAVPTAMNATTAAAQQAVPLARQAVPLARTAGTSIKSSTDGAVTWATPYVDTAREWAAPRLEQSATALSENIAPMISSALLTAAHKIDTNKPKRRRFGKSAFVIGALLLAAAGAAAAMSMQRRRDAGDGYSATPMPEDGPGPDSSYGAADAGPPDADANGHPIV